MKLSELVHYLNQIDHLLQHHAETAVFNEICPLHHLVTTHHIQFPNYSNVVDFNLKQVGQSLERFDKSISSLRTTLTFEIDRMSEQYFDESYKNYQDAKTQDTIDYILNRKLFLSADSQEFVFGRLSKYSDWRYPGLIFRPGTEEWINLLVGLDPLYVVDEHMELLKPLEKKFNPQYLDRLRMYPIDETPDQKILDQLPDSQFAFALAYNYFNYKPVEIIARYLNEVFTKLKPGGIFAFTFNNCDKSYGVELVERKYMCYTPKSIVLEKIKQSGFEMELEKDLDASNTWIEVKKPGTLSTFRGGQTLAKIIDKSFEISNNKQ